jgi:hypothetical protein
LRKNKFTFSRVQASAWHGAKAPRKDNGIFDRIIDIFQAFAAQPGASASPLQKVTFVLREP